MPPSVSSRSYQKPAKNSAQYEKMMRQSPVAAGGIGFKTIDTLTKNRNNRQSQSVLKSKNQVGLTGQLDQLNNARAEFNKSVSGVSKAKSMASFRINQMDT